MTMLVWFLCHMALMWLLSGHSYCAHTTALQRPLRTDKATTNKVANNNEKQQTDESDELVLDILNLEKGTDGSDQTLDSSEEVNALELLNCSLPASLDRFCTDINEEVHAYFNFDMSVTGLLASLYKDNIVKTVMANCTPGSWCLPNRYHQELTQGKSTFYSVSPLCSATIWSCLEAMFDERLDCEEEDLEFLLDSMYLLCDMEEEDTLQPECYARTMEALYVTHVAHLGNVAGSMTKTYLRAVDACNNPQKRLLNKFESWEGIIDNIDETSALCNISYHNTDVSTTPYSGDTEGEDEDLEKFLAEIASEMEDAAETESGIVDNGSNEVNANADGAKQADNQTVVIAAVVVTTVMVAGFLGLALLSYRRCRARCGYDRWEYSKLGDEESKLLRGEFT